MISATRPDDLDLPELRQALSREKTVQTVQMSRQLAAQRQDRSLLAWLERQQLSARAARLTELEEEVRDLAAERIGQPLLDRVIPRLLDDPETRGALSEEILTERVARWPVVRLVHTLLSPVFVLLRGATARNAAPLQSPQGLVEIVLRESGCSPSDLVQTTFAQLRQTRPEMAEIYAHQKLWEQMQAELAAAELRRALTQTVESQREAARSELIKGDLLGAPIRWLLTIGAILWFPFIQPILEKVLAVANFSFWHWSELAQMLVAVLGVNYLLKSVGFLAIYFTVLWLALRWNTQRKVTRVMSKLRDADSPDPNLNPFSQTLQWLDALTLPVRQMRDRMQSLARRAEAARQTVTKAA